MQHSGTDAARAQRELPYLGTRASYTRRAFAVDVVPRADSTIAYPSLTAALPWVPAWDPPALARAIDGGRAGDVQRSRSVGGHPRRDSSPTSSIRRHPARRFVRHGR